MLRNRVLENSQVERWQEHCQGVDTDQPLAGSGTCDNERAFKGTRCRNPDLC